MEHRAIYSIALYIVFGASTYALTLSSSLAQVIPNAADIGRIKTQKEKPLLPPSETAPFTLPKVTKTLPVPKGAENMQFSLREVRVEGATVFTPAQLRDIYDAYLHKEISLETAYSIAGAITERYRQAGYFLSLAYVPNQRITEGVLVIAVTEGYISHVDIQGEAKHSSVVKGYIKKIKAQKPISAQVLESYLLRLNDLAGYTFDAVLSPSDKNNGAVLLTLTTTPKKAQGSLSINNFSSRFLGPHQAIASYTTSLFSLQRTTITGLNSAPFNRLHYVSLDHSAVIAPDVTLRLSGTQIKAKPGYTLKPFEIESDASFLSTSLDYQWVRQRDTNLSVFLTIDGRNTTKDALDSLLTRDRIRTVRTGLSYDNIDTWQGYTATNMTLSHGIAALGASEKGELTLSRAQAVPDFTKLQFSVARLQTIDEEWSLLMNATGQIASDPLFSSEEFGYGGQAFGRAYDMSELVGDHGIAGSLELRYNGWNQQDSLSLAPYVFYDIGKVWNKDTGVSGSESGSSIGMGFRSEIAYGVNTNIGIAWPLSRDVDNPIYGNSGHAPRVIFELSRSF